MWKNKKLVIVTIAAVAVLAAGSIATMAFARNASAATSGNSTLLSRVAAILNGQGVNVTEAQLKGAFEQAQKEQRDNAITAYLDKLVKDGKITQAQADQYKQWWQSKPNVTIPGAGQRFATPHLRGGMMGGQFFGRPAPRPPAIQTPLPQAQ